jgi:hypothetical protein
LIQSAAATVAAACPRSCRSVLAVDVTPVLEQALVLHGLEVRREPVARGSVAAVVAQVARVDEPRLGALRLAIGRRGRFFALCKERLLPDVLAGLARRGLQPKGLWVPEGPQHGWVVVVAAAGRPGGLVVQRYGPNWLES